MTNIILRRRKLGKTSTENIRDNMNNPTQVVLLDRDPIPNDIDVLFRWGCTGNARARRTFNRAEAIHYVNDKRQSRKDFADAGMAPRTWLDHHELDMNVPVIGAPLSFIIRPQRHAQGRSLYKCDNIGQVMDATRRINGPYYISEFIPKIAEYRVFVANGRVVWVACKTPGNPQDIAWNVARGGRFDNVRWGEWPLNVVDLACRVFNMTALDFGGVDVMVGPDGQCYCLEINSAPSQTSPYRQSCVAKVFDYMIEHGNERIPAANRGEYLRYIHPSLDEKARI